MPKMMNNSISSEQVRLAWDTNAAFWDERMGEGNMFHLQLVEPSVLRLLEIRDGERVLEIACGNGQFARKLSSLGANVTATDFSPQMLERAAAHTEPFNDRVEYRVLDATSANELAGLESNAYDAIVCNMALMDMSEIGPLFDALPRLLRSRGRFVFATMHPCFNSNNPVFMAEMRDVEGEIVEEYAIKLSKYLTPGHFAGLAILGQPMPQYYFHRPLSELLGAAFRVGLVCDGFLEPRLAAPENVSRWSSWANYREFPPVIVVRCVVR
jgi:2-polyprenyl-3-methyl-5-hydroxy-6-metoxy-1,4-benzoquinol methylase